MIFASQVTVTATAASIQTQIQDQHLIVTNRGTNPCFIGGLGVTSANGFELVTGDSVSLDIAPTDTIWAVSPLGTTLHILESRF